jgi:hypothetical protein
MVSADGAPPAGRFLCQPGQTEPYEMAKNRISAILINKQKADFMTKFEDELYNDAIKDKSIRFYKK